MMRQDFICLSGQAGLKLCIATALTGARPVDIDPDYDYCYFTEGSVTDWCGVVSVRLFLVRYDGVVVHAFRRDYRPCEDGLAIAADAVAAFLPACTYSTLLGNGK